MSMKHIKKKYQLYKEILDLGNDIFHEIHYDIVLSDLEISYEEFIKHLYKQYSIYDVPEYFTKDNFHLLVQLLRDFGKHDLVRALQEMGFFFPDSEILDWIEHYYSMKMNYLNNHSIDPEFLEISIAGCQNPIDGFTFYYNYQIDEEKILKKSAEIFLKKRNLKMNEFHLYLLGFSCEIYNRKSHYQDECLNEFFKRLFHYCFENHLLNREDFETKQNLSNNIRIDYLTMQYLNILELQSLPSDKKSLKKIYYRLIKKYHPDKNPNGLQKTQKIIEAYEYLSRKYEN